MYWKVTESDMPFKAVLFKSGIYLHTRIDHRFSRHIGLMQRLVGLHLLLDFALLPKFKVRTTICDTTWMEQQVCVCEELARAP